MNLLLDTQAFLWLDTNEEKLSAAATAACADLDNELWLSVVSVWEMQIKISIGKLRLQRALPEIINDQCSTNGIQILGVELGHAFEVGNLPLHHKDPFDRLLIAQARHEGFPIVSKDPEFARYPISVIW
jgi:PIN domain nuclease of toxin-antitoxin system